MISKILLPVDNSLQAETILSYALDEFPTAAVTALYVVKPPEGYYAAFIDSDDQSPTYRRDRHQGEELLQRLTANAAERDLEIETVLITGKPADEIVSYADQNGFDQILMGSQHRGVRSRLLRPSVPAAVARRSLVPVMIVHSNPVPGPSLGLAGNRPTTRKGRVE